MFDYGNSTEVVYQNPKDSDYYMNNISYHFIKSNEKKINSIILRWYKCVYKELEYEKKTTLLTNTGSHF